MTVRARWDERAPVPERRLWRSLGAVGLGFAAIAVVAMYELCKVEVGTGQQAVLIRRVGLELEPQMELAPARKGGRLYYKSVQTEGPNRGVLTEGRYFYNPLYWSWEIGPQFIIPDNKIGVRVALD